MKYHFGIIGKPLKHSQSKLFFDARFAADGIDADYSIHELDAIEDVQVSLARLRQALKDFNGKSSIGTLGVTPRKSNDFKYQFLAVLQQNRFNKSKVARVYGVGRRTIYRWMKEYGIE